MSFPKIVSRRSLRLLLETHPRLSPSRTKLSTPCTKDTSWPRSFQIMGYSLLCLSVPYSFLVVVSESCRLREFIEDYSIVGKSLVEWTRWYWGEYEHAPYFEFMDNKEKTVSLPNELCGKIREEQKEIERYINSDILVGVTYMVHSDNKKVVGSVRGDIYVNDLIGIWNTVSGKTQFSFDVSNGLALTFEDDNEKDLMTPTERMGRVKDEVFYLRNLINIWSAWSYFPTGNIDSLINKPSHFNSRTSRRMTTGREIELKISELEWHVSELRRNLCDPTCTQDRDDMESRLWEYKKELGIWRRRSWCSHWWNLFSKRNREK